MQVSKDAIFFTDTKDIINEVANRRNLIIESRPFSSIKYIIPNEQKVGVDGEEWILKTPAMKQLYTKFDVPLSHIKLLRELKEFDPEKMIPLDNEMWDVIRSKKIAQYTSNASIEKEALGFIKYPDYNIVSGVVGREATSENKKGYNLLYHDDLLDVIRNHEKFNLLSVNDKNNYISDTEFQMTFLSNTEKKDFKVGDVFQFGFAVRNSDTGKRSASTQLFFKILRCSNGAFTEEMIRSEFVYHSNSEILNKMGLNMNRYLDGRTFDMIANLLSKSIEKKPILDSVEAIPTFLKQVGVPQKYHSDIQKVFEEDNDSLPLNGWGIANAMNRFATHGMNRIKEINKNKFEEDSEFYEVANDLLKKSFSIMMMGIPIQQTILA